jgi:hypothetical protein
MSLISIHKNQFRRTGATTRVAPTGIIFYATTAYEIKNQRLNSLYDFSLTQSILSSKKAWEQTDTALILMPSLPITFKLSML